MGEQVFEYNHAFELECGIALPKIKITYQVYGDYQAGKKVAWVCHALTANMLSLIHI